MTTNDHSERELMPPRLFDDCQEADIGYLYRDGFSTPQIARLFETNHNTIQKVLKRIKVATGNVPFFVETRLTAIAR
jgi:hypothetical protein